MKSVMSHKFSEVPRAEIPRSSFDRSHGVKTTFDSGKLIPFFADEALPGDTFNLRTSGFARMSTPLYPLMDNLYLDTFYFAIPIRLLWSNFQKMMGEQDNPGDSVDYTVPTVTAGGAGFNESGLSDYLGIPTKIANLQVNSLFHRAYNLVWNEWFRDQNLQDSITVPLNDGPDSETYYTLRPRGKRHDYFTSALPWPQKGIAVELPLGSTAPIQHVDGFQERLRRFDTDAYPSVNTDLTAGASDGRIINTSTGSPSFYIDPNGALEADLSSATASTINQLRQAFQIQKMYERDARGGTRYTEIVKSHFGVSSPDSRLQRPEYLGGGSSPINITPIAQTSESGTTAQGTLAAMGTSSFQGHGFTKSFTEHSVIIGLINVRADLTYQQGLNKMFSREDKLDFYWPALSHIGEQAVLNKEIYTQGTADDDEVFGYQERFAEYRYKPSTIHGAFRSNATTPLDAWHLSQDFATKPTLGATFIEDTPPISRVVAVPSEPEFIGDFYHKLNCARPMPMFGTPGMIDHF
ncbi:MAG: major capsid protein [Microviridae sp.]|nr:MAG: major capsid protein [Microviridae sp.]